MEFICVPDLQSFIDGTSSEYTSVMGVPLDHRDGVGLWLFVGASTGGACAVKRERERERDRDSHTFRTITMTVWEESHDSLPQLTHPCKSLELRPGTFLRHYFSVINNVG